MSGGALDYAFTHIYGVFERVKEYRKEVVAKGIEEFGFDAKRMNIAPEELKWRVIQNLDNAIVALKVAEVYAKRIEWLISDDDGYDDFVNGVAEDLNEASVSMGAGGDDEV